MRPAGTCLPWYRLQVTLEGYGKCFQAVLDIGRPTLVLGAGGFNQINTARAWCSATAMVCEVQLADELPPHDFVEYYLPESTLQVARPAHRTSPRSASRRRGPTCARPLSPPQVGTVEMTNKNSAESIQATLDASMEAAQQIPVRAAPPALPKIAAPDGATATGAAPTGTAPANGGAMASPHLTANEALLASPSCPPLAGRAACDCVAPWCACGRPCSSGACGHLLDVSKHFERAGSDVPMDAASTLEPAAKASGAGAAETPDPMEVESGPASAQCAPVAAATSAGEVGGSGGAE